MPFSASLSVATKALAAATIVGVADFDVLVVVGAPSVDVAAGGVVAPAAASLVGAAPLAGVDAASAVAAVVAVIDTLVAGAVGCCAARGTAVAVALAEPHAFSSAATADTPVSVSTCLRNARRVAPCSGWFTVLFSISISYVSSLGRSMFLPTSHPSRRLLPDAARAVQAVDNIRDRNFDIIVNNFVDN